MHALIRFAKGESEEICAIKRDIWYANKGSDLHARVSTSGMDRGASRLGGTVSIHENEPIIRRLRTGDNEGGNN